MTRPVLLTTLVIVGFFLLPWRSPLWPQGAPAKTQAEQTQIEGVWTEVCYENEGRLLSMLPADSDAVPVAYLWKISKEKIEMGPDNHRFPRQRFTYQLDPGNKAGTMDLTILDKEKWQKNAKLKRQAIYFVKDDFLIVCWSPDGRPETFTTSSKPNTTWLYILRRGKLELPKPKGP